MCVCLCDVAEATRATLKTSLDGKDASALRLTDFDERFGHGHLAMIGGDRQMVHPIRLNVLD